MNDQHLTPEEIARRKRTDFLITSVIFCLLIIAGAVAAFYVRTRTPALIVSIICVLWLIYSFIKQIKKFLSEKNNNDTDKA